MIEQSGFSLDDGTGLRVAEARFVGESKFDWNLFRGFDKLRVLTYSASIPAIVRMLDDFGFSEFECVFGSEATLRDVKYILAFQQVAVGDVRAAIMGLKDERHAYILDKVQDGLVRFRVLRKYIAHAKLYLLENSDSDSKRVIIGSANLSERAFSGRQPETLVAFDDDVNAWAHYMKMYTDILNSASDEIPLPPERIVKAEIKIDEVPAISDKASTLVIDQVSAEELQFTVPTQLEKIEKIKAAVVPHIAAAIPAFRKGKQRITPQAKREISRVQLVKSADEADHRYLSINRAEGTAILTGEPFSLDWDDELASADARLLSAYFGNYEGAFEGNVPKLQWDYFTLWSWLYFSPFMCDMRTLARNWDEDVIRYPSFAIIHGKSHCGKTNLIDTLIASMFGRVFSVYKSSFTKTNLQGLQQSYKRFPVFFDDIGKRAFREHGMDLIKVEDPPPVAEYPGFVFSMNSRDSHAFPDEIVKRSFKIYTATALPPHKEGLRQQMDSKIQATRRGLTGHLYRRYLAEVMARLEEDRLPDDWLALSSGVLSSIIADATEESLPRWCQQTTWLEYAEKRYGSVKARLNHLLRSAAMAKNEGNAPNGWMLDGDRVVVWEQRDAFGRSGFEWEEVPSTLIDEDACSGGRTVLYLTSLEEFLERDLRPKRRGLFARIALRSG